MSRLLALLLVLSIAPTWAQEDVKKDSTEATTTPEEAKTEPATREDSPFDYESSEQISEDLSVSFPVDI